MTMADAVLGQETGVSIWVILGGAGLLLALWGRVEARFAKSDAATAKISDETTETATKLATELSEYKLFVARNHITAPQLRETEERLIIAMDKIAARMEQMVARLDTIAVNVASTAAAQNHNRA